MASRACFIASLVILTIASSAIAADGPITLNVWPGVAPNLPANPPPEKWEGRRVTNVTQPTLTVFRPAKDKDTGVAVIVCPGGGYKWLMMSYEGDDVAAWLNTIGVTGIVLKYRVAAPEGTPGYVPALKDAQRAISLVRSKAVEWQINPDRIGILGFSAGGHLAAALSTNFGQRSYEPIDDADKASCRPDFSVLIYPGALIEKGTEQLSPEIRVSKQTPPAFIVMASDDPVDSENCIFYYLALKRDHVSAEMHLYASGGHGFGIRKSDKPCAEWPQRMAEWMKSRKILPATPNEGPK